MAANEHLLGTIAALELEKARIDQMIEQLRALLTVQAAASTPQVAAQTPAAPVVKTESDNRPAVPPPSGKVLSPKESAEFLGIDVQKVYILSQQGYLRRWPEGRLIHFKFDEAELLWLSENLQGIRDGVVPPPFPPAVRKHIHRRTRAEILAAKLEEAKAANAHEAAARRQAEAERQHVKLPPILAGNGESDGPQHKAKIWNVHKNISIRQAVRIARDLGCEVEQGETIRFMPPPGLIGRMKSLQRRQSSKDAGQELAHWLLRIIDNDTPHMTHRRAAS